MRALTPEEVFELEDCAPGSHKDAGSNWNPPPDLVKRGYLRTWLADDREYFETTSRGQLALRVHRSYLASIGATS